MLELGFVFAISQSSEKCLACVRHLTSVKEMDQSGQRGGGGRLNTEEPQTTLCLPDPR